MTKQERLEYMRNTWSPVKREVIISRDNTADDVKEELGLMDTVREEFIQKKHLSNGINSDEVIDI